MKQNEVKVSGIVSGLLIIGAGALLFLFNTGVLPIEYKSVVFSWQTLMIAIGFTSLFSRQKWFFGIMLMLLGGFFVLPKVYTGDWTAVHQYGWIIGLVIAGTLIISKSIFGRRFLNSDNNCNPKGQSYNDRHPNKWRSRGKNESGYIERNYVFGGANEKINYPNFKGGDINCVFGGFELDLSDSQLAEGVNNLQINSVFGGLILYVPIEWNVEIRQSQVLGNFVDNRPKPGFVVDEKRVLILEVASFFGGGEIKCKNI